jgi:hypothetical protein
MPDFTVIEGGGGSGEPKKPEDSPIRAQDARDAFERLLIEVLRATARGEDAGARVVQSLQDFLTAARETSARSYDLIDDTFRRIYEYRLKPTGDGKREDETKAVALAALSWTAEMIATDGFAKGRRSQREDKLTYAIEELIRYKEEKAREWGGSYVEDVTKNLGPWPPTRSVPSLQLTSKRPSGPKRTRKKTPPR